MLCNKMPFTDAGFNFQTFGLMQVL